MDAERDSTADWVLPAEAAPPLLADLELKVDEALALARSSEAAVTEIGALALDAAERAGRAARLAERAATVAAGGSSQVEGDAGGNDGNGNGSGGTAAEEALRRFTERADRVAARLRAV